MTDNLPDLGAVFWPVGTGDSTTLVVDDQTVVQIDIHDLVKADDDTTPEVAVLDRLVEALPVRDGRPYLSVFVLTHADLDHCRGFTDLLSEVTIGELWATPRLWREFADGTTTICDDAKRFQEEAVRRVDAALAAAKNGKTAAAGDRIRVIGYDTDHDDHAYSGLPQSCLSYPGQAVTVLDGTDHAGRFEAFLHAPFKDDCAQARNETSVGMQVTLTDGQGTARFLLLGDLAHDTLMKIFDYSEAHGRATRVAWDVLLAPHHCSKAVMYDSGGNVQDDVLDALARNAGPGAAVVSSSAPVPASNTPGQNPPHAKAKARYEEISTAFVCTMENGGEEQPAPVVVTVEQDGWRLADPTAPAATAKSARAAAPGRLALAAAAAAAYGADRAAGTPRTPAGARPGTGPDRVRAAVARDRGDATAPGAVTGFGRR